MLSIPCCSMKTFVIRHMRTGQVSRSRFTVWKSTWLLLILSVSQPNHVSEYGASNATGMTGTQWSLPNDCRPS
jgi:hypothetical protein